MINTYLLKISILKVNQNIGTTSYEFKGTFSELQEHLNDLGCVNMLNHYIKYDNGYTEIITITKVKGGN